MLALRAYDPNMPEPIELKRLTPPDASLMRGLNAMFGEAFDDLQTYGGQPPDDAYLEALLGRDSVIALAAIANGVVVGGLAAYVLDKFEQARREVYIYDLAVLEAWRRQGVATGLIRRLQEIAADLGAWVIYVQADHGDDPAIALYGGLGVREDVMHFDIPVVRKGAG